MQHQFPPSRYIHNQPLVQHRAVNKQNDALVNGLLAEGIITSPVIEQVMRSIDRGLYVPHHIRTLSPLFSAKSIAYFDQPAPIDYNATISAPHMHAMCLELLKDHLKYGCAALDVGSGSGYLTAAMALLIKAQSPAGAPPPQGRVYGIEHVEQLANSSVENIRSDHPELLDEHVVEILARDGRQGLATAAPFDAIHVGAASETIPEVLLEQLKPGGRMVVPVGKDGHIQYLTVVDKRADGTIEKSKIVAVRYVPLCDKNEQLRGN